MGRKEIPANSKITEQHPSLLADWLPLSSTGVAATY
jgi:hypothetical protein